jgi:hypothetical protein
LLVTAEFELFNISVRTNDKAHTTAVTSGEKLIAVMFFTVSCMPIFNVTDTFKQLVDVFTFIINRGKLAKDSRLLFEAFIVTTHWISSSLQQEQPRCVERNVIRGDRWMSSK